jgi:hypothetical protein
MSNKVKIGNKVLEGKDINYYFSKKRLLKDLSIVGILINKKKLESL